MPQFIEDHPDTIAARANAELRAEGVTDLRFDALPSSRSRRAMAETAQTIEAAQTEQDAPSATDAGPTPAEVLRGRLAAVLRCPQARGKVDAALAIALFTDMATDQIKTTLRDLPDGVALGLQPKAIADPEAKAEADRITAIMTADVAAGNHDHAVALALDTYTEVDAALAVLGAMPKPVNRAAVEARFSEGDWFGQNPTEMEDIHGDQTAAGWSDAVSKANARFETAPTEAPISPDRMMRDGSHD
mgnify:CR=1 FL=1